MKRAIAVLTAGKGDAAGHQKVFHSYTQFFVAGHRTQLFGPKTC
jgi:hypothetical protein